MPILVDKDCHWTENEQLIQLTLPLKGISPQNADVFCTSEYLKVSYAPYLFEALLSHKIDTKSSKILIANGSIQINLKKEECKIWGKLKSEQSKDRSVMKQKREEAFEEAKSKDEEVVSDRARTKDRQKKEGVSQQMDLESDVRKKIESVKESERDLAASAFAELREDEMVRSESSESESVPLSFGVKKNVRFDFSDEEPDQSPTELKENISKTKPDSKVAKHSTSSKFRTTQSKIFSTETVAETKAPIRSKGTIQCQFTPRFFPTPERESKKAEEEEWLAKLAEARRNPKSGLKPEVEPNDYPNTNPQWLKDRGDQLFRNGDFKSAYNAYSEAVKLDTLLPSVYANRSLCLLKMLQYEDCIKDCDRALELSEPQVDANRRQRANISARRGAAKAELERYEEAVGDYEMAIRLCPELESLRTDKAKLEMKLAGRSQEVQ